jgi:hypothetical protein
MDKVVGRAEGKEGRGEELDVGKGKKGRREEENEEESFIASVRARRVCIRQAARLPNTGDRKSKFGGFGSLRGFARRAFRCS